MFHTKQDSRERARLKSVEFSSWGLCWRNEIENV